MSIETERLVLRLPLAEDEEAFIDLFSDSETQKWNGGALTSAQARKRFIETHDQIDFKLRLEFAVTLKDLNQMIGIVGFSSLGSSSNDAAYGFSIHSRHWNRGYGREAGTAVWKATMAKARSEVIVANSHVDNLRSHRLLRSLGFEPVKQEGDWVQFETKHPDAPFRLK